MGHMPTMEPLCCYMSPFDGVMGASFSVLLTNEIT